MAQQPVDPLLDEPESLLPLLEPLSHDADAPAPQDSPPPGVNEGASGNTSRSAGAALAWLFPLDSSEPMTMPVINPGPSSVSRAGGGVRGA